MGFKSWLPHNTFLFGTSLLVFALTFIEVVDFVELPFENALGVASVGGLFSSLVKLESTAGYFGLFALMLLESASLPIPSEVILPLAGYLVSLGKMGFAQALLVSSLGGLVGAYIDYYLAKLVGRPVLVSILKKIKVKEESLVKAETWFNRGGVWAVLLARFVPIMRSLISFPAGLLKMNRVIFGLVTFIGSVIWCLLLIYVGYQAGALWQTSARQTEALLNILTVYALLVLSAFYIVYYLVSKSPKSAFVNKA
ncbi:hypothetical protein B9Q02_08530 [Candidatus Marsarchaeota G1 archaeon BE_D]|jgi:membrane protein DedA with SNARE-associated domain|uniref:VTT domain-containing protein n=1 Tax=Candidatus Marsarchaeota G1 archaeon BE_D TaxID=1978156 RepID=A0A2R6AEW6_9ARCH|nr:MAG: hypothetical protein B9Q02_08530 [Candidatus Marsarchaeota G1 archaeon BE_D]